MLVREAEVRGVVDSQLAYTIVTIKQAKSSGGKVGRWLNLAEVGQLISAAALVNPEQALRNTALVALLVGCGLRRTEAVTLRWPQWRKADGRWIVADIVGKGNKRRTVPANKWVGEIVNDYHAVAHACAGACSDSEDSHEPLLFPFTPQQAYTIVSRAAAIAGLGEVRPHDLRRTYAKLSRASGAQIEQISVALGHSSVVTTEKYLGSRLELAAGKACGDAIADPRERTD
jgi:integrase